MPFLSISTNVLLVIVGIGLLIFIHELGHFLVAKKCGVRVYAFSLGFGPAIFKKQYGETEYRLSILPLGGYVKLAGEVPDEGNTGEEWEFMSKTPGQRAAVLSAGVGLNAVLAFIAFIVAFKVGVPFVSTEIGDIMPGWPAWEAGLQQGDKILKINKNSSPDFEDIFTEVALSGSNSGIHLTVERDGKNFDTTLLPRYDKKVGIQRIGIKPAASLAIEKIFTYEQGRSPAVEAGLIVGDVIVSVDGHNMKNGNEFIAFVTANAGKELNLKIIREGVEQSAKLTPRSETRRMLGVSSASTQIEAIKRDSVASSIGLKNNDIVLSIDSNKVGGWSEVQNVIKDLAPGTYQIEVARGNETKFVELPISDDKSKIEFASSIFPASTLVIDSVIEGFPAEKMGIKSGDEIIAINDEEIATWDDLLQLVIASQANPIKVTWMSDGKVRNATVRTMVDEKHPFGKIGVKLKDDTILKKYGFFGACAMGVNKTIVNVQRIYFTLKGFATGKVSNKALGGPILIAQASYESAKLGIGKLLYFLGIISINLAFLNIMPIPVLDGGHLLFLLVEKIKGSPVSERTISIANYVGMGLVLSLVLFATRNDVMRILNIL